MANSDYRFVYSNENDNLIILVPDNETETLEQLKEKQCPNDIQAFTVKKEFVPVDESSKDLWAFWEDAIEQPNTNSETSST
tara:strand:+ start:274 stop:516 length:243 start_codon:yes stop_codon:yes gene_type:complete